MTLSSQKKILFSDSSGLTIVELLIALAIIVVLLSVTFSSFLSFKRSRIVAQSSERILVLIREARSLTLASKEGSRYGVYFSSNSVTMYQDTYSPTNTENKVITIDPPAQISATALFGGGSNLIFDRLTGETSQYGVVTISSSVAGSDDVREISISKSGLTEMN